jgi:glutamate dehydrogenase/leucine dehydrogenase
MVIVEAVEESKLKATKAYNEHKNVFRIKDDESGLNGFIAIHEDRFGPAVGGTRMLPYNSESEALEDVLQLSRAMTYKCALAGVQHGGGKGVIIGDAKTKKNEALLRAYAKAVKQLNGQFYTGEDVGMAEEDVNLMLLEAPFFIGKPDGARDPSPYAALSTFVAMKAIAQIAFGSDSLKGKKVAIKGVGKVGGELVRLLVEQGAVIKIADINADTTNKIKQNFPSVEIVDARSIHAEDVDIYSPCALSNEFNPTTMEQIHARVICGAANNQLASDSIGDWLFENKIYYVPDYIANAGGLIDVADELNEGGYNEARVLEKINNIKNTVKTIFEFANLTGRAPNRVADNFAEDLFKH